MSELRKYGVATTINVPLVIYGSTDLLTSDPGSWESGDIQISKDGGSFVDITNSSPSWVGRGFVTVTFTAAEMQASRIILSMIDQSTTKVFEDQSILIETYGNESAQHGFDLGVPLVGYLEDIETTLGTPTVSVSEDIAEIDIKVDDVILALGSPVDMGDGDDISAMITAIAGKTTDASSYDRVTDSLQAQHDEKIIHRGTAQTGGYNSIVLDPGASGTDGIYSNDLVVIISGTGAGQCRGILQYEGLTKYAVVDRNWAVNPDSTSVFVLLPGQGRNAILEGLAYSGTSDTITLRDNASSIDDIYANRVIFLKSGPGAGQSRVIASYDGATRVATVADNWETGQEPDGSTGYVILPEVSPETALDWTAGEKSQIRDALGVDGTKVAAEGGDIQSIRTSVGNISLEIGTSSLGEGSLHRKLGAYSGASGEGNNVKDSIEASSAGLQPADRSYLEDILFTRAVLTRHSNQKPKDFTAGSGGNQRTIRTSQDVNGNTSTEVLIS